MSKTATLRAVKIWILLIYYLHALRDITASVGWLVCPSHLVTAGPYNPRKLAWYSAMFSVKFIKTEGINIIIFFLCFGSKFAACSIISLVIMGYHTVFLSPSYHSLFPFFFLFLFPLFLFSLAGKKSISDFDSTGIQK